MSTIRKTPKKAVPSLLARLSKAKEYALQVVEDHGDDMSLTLVSKFENIENKMQDTEKSLLQIKKREMMMVEHLGELDDEIFSIEYPSLESRVGDKLKLIEADVGKLKSLISTVEDQSPSDSENQTDDDHGKSTTQETADHLRDEVLESKGMPFLSECFHCLESSQLKMCLLLLSVFPENEAIKKRPLIYWWIGEGLVTERSNATAEEVGERIFQELLNQSLLINPITRNSFTVYPWIRRMLIQLAQKNSFLKFTPEETPCNAYGRAFLWQGNAQSHAMDVDLVTIYNMNEQYLESSPEMLSRPRKLKVLQMGRWQDSATHHIEAEDYEKLFERLGSQKHLKYLSLRGISRIETLPQSIRKLTSLLILDLRACHNLNKLPEEVAELRSLTHLDVSECYLLDSMPNGLQRLSDLQVLKGFVVSNSNSNSCNISDLAQLPCLRKLSVRVGNEQQLGSLIHFKALHILTITWRVITSDEALHILPRNLIELPKNLIKLDLRSVPFNSVPEWMEPGKLPNLKKLYIKGGRLSTLCCNKSNTLTHPKQYEKVEFVRLNYLKHLQISEQELVSMFPKHQYLQRTNCHGPDPDLARAGHAS